MENEEKASAEVLGSCEGPTINVEVVGKAHFNPFCNNK